MQCSMSCSSGSRVRSSCLREIIIWEGGFGVSVGLRAEEEGGFMKSGAEKMSIREGRLDGWDDLRLRTGRLRQRLRG
jgi:hypothetical protein